MAFCGKCDAEIFWVRRADNGAPIPINAQNAMGGTVEHTHAGAVLVKGNPYEMRAVLHWVTCAARRADQEAKRAEKKAAAEAKAKRQLGLFR
jgi:hypothetical protein